MNSPGTIDAIVEEIAIKAPAERIFDALTDPAARVNGGDSKAASKPRIWNPICAPAAAG
jgi:hypothetical protein